jgi:uncharacterized membrane protein (UPF0127 family)
VRSPNWPSRTVVTDRRSPRAALVALALLAAGCDRDTDASSGTDQASPGSTVPGTADDLVVPEGFDRTVARLETAAADDDSVVELDVWFAGEPAQRQQGLMTVTDLGGADGMLFAFDAPARYRFYMWQTPMPLDIYFFDADGQLVGYDAMEPCLDGSAAACERYSPDTPFLLALEVSPGSLDAFAIDDTWTLSFEMPAPDASSPPPSD